MREHKSSMRVRNFTIVKLEGLDFFCSVSLGFKAPSLFYRKKLAISPALMWSQIQNTCWDLLISPRFPSGEEANTWHFMAILRSAQFGSLLHSIPSVALSVEGLHSKCKDMGEQEG